LQKEIGRQYCENSKTPGKCMLSGFKKCPRGGENMLKKKKVIKYFFMSRTKRQEMFFFPPNIVVFSPSGGIKQGRYVILHRYKKHPP
jgi:hypothetical protein